LIKARLWAQIVAGMLLGVGVGVALGPSVAWVTPGTAMIVGEWLALPGMMFLAVIQMIVIPLVVSAIIRGIAASSNAEQLQKNGIWLASYFVATTMVATAIGIGLAYLIRPGRFVESATMLAGAAPFTALEPGSSAGGGIANLPNRVVSVFPTNPLQSMVEGQMLQVVLFSIVVGIAILGLEAKSAEPIIDLLGALQELTMKIVSWAMKLAPLAVFGLLARQLASTGLDALLGLAAYVGTFLFGMVLLLVIYLLVARIWAGRSPLAFLAGAREAQLLAFSTDSSAATMPMTLEVAEEKLGVRSSVAQFVIPIGASMNMGGSALYQGLATVFMAQIYGMNLSFAALLALVVTSLGAAIGTPATPGVGIVVLATVLTSAGVPVEGLGLILGVDQILERFRTVLNVSGDLVACTVMEHRSASQEPAA
jgi:Na+/H+-dicarboxylate symporter